MAITDLDREKVVRRWFEVLSGGSLDTLDDIVAWDVTDHSNLGSTYGGGCEGHKKLVGALRNALPGYQPKIDSVEVNGDLVTVRHSGSAPAAGNLASIAGASAVKDAAVAPLSFEVVSTLRVDDNGKIVEHWATAGPMGDTGGPNGYPTGGQNTGTPALNKVFMQNYVRNVIDGMNPALAAEYFRQNFYNHDPAPGEQPGLTGVTAFIASIFAAFSQFHTTIDEQVAVDDLVAGRWSQSFVNTGPYLGFPASNKKINIGGITITRVRDGRIVEEWEARDALSLIEQMGIPSPLGPLEGGDGGSASSSALDLVRRYYYDIWDAGELAEIADVFDQGYRNNGPEQGQDAGPAGVGQFVQALRTGFPDGSVSIDLQFGSGDKVVTRYTFRGTQQGTFRAVPATGKRVEITGIDIHQVQGDKIVQRWGFFDNASLVAQLGLIQYPGQSGGAPGSAGGGTSTPPW